jgi:hypothetical protein
MTKEAYMNNLSERLRPGSEAAPWVIEAVRTLEAEVERLHEQVQDMIDASGQDCGCGYDKPNDVCLGHWPAYKKQQDKIDILTRKVDYLSKNKCIGCIDAICDDCAGTS